MERLSAVLGQAVQFVYTCWDRIVLNGYLDGLQRPEYLVHFFHDVGLDYVSCSPFRVPVARLEAGRAAVTFDDTAEGLAGPR